MDFRELASAETSALVRRLAASGSDKSARDLKALRATLDTALQTLESALQAHAPSDDEVKTLVDRMTELATKEIEAAVERTRAEGQAALDKVQTALTAETGQVSSLRAALKEEGKQAETLRNTLKNETENANALRSALKAEQDQTTALKHQLANAGTAKAVAEAARKTAEATSQREAAEKAALQHEKTSMEKELKDARRQLESLRSESAAAKRDSAARIQSLEGANAELEARLGEIEVALDTAVDQSRTVREHAIKLVAQPFDRLRAAFQRLTTATEIEEVLGILIDALAGEFARVAAFRVNGNRLEGMHQIGFDLDSDISKVAVPLTLESPLTDAARSGRVKGLTAAELTDSGRSLFGGAPTFVLALPVAAGDEMLAVLYADDSDQPVNDFATADRRVKFAEVLLWYAVPLLTRLAAEDTTLSEYREYAHHLVKELESVYAADVAAGLPHQDIKTRVQQNLDYARRVFGHRVEAKGSRAAGLLAREVAAMVRAKISTPFAADLAAAAGLAVTTKPAKRPAKAS
jgi:hypothetical protein